jgi:hypothetical protein
MLAAYTPPVRRIVLIRLRLSTSQTEGYVTLLPFMPSTAQRHAEILRGFGLVLWRRPNAALTRSLISLSDTPWCLTKR